MNPPATANRMHAQLLERAGEPLRAADVPVPVPDAARTAASLRDFYGPPANPYAFLIRNFLQ